MSAREFQSLYYTDCRPGQGLRGGAGFQFQAVSPGTTDEMMTAVQRSALYEAPVGWMREKRPVSQYPPSLVHVHDEIYATARGIYLGAEAGGVREGNQFTHALATTDPQLYGPIRPAQLWDAPWWGEQPADSTECEAVSAEPEAGPLGVEALRDWVLGQQDGESWLLAVHSALDRVHEEGAPRVVFVSEDAETAVRWIAVGTLLLPQERALRVGFRVFATNPQYARHEVLAVHPDWAGSLADPDRNTDSVVFNLVSGKHREVEPTDAAQHWVPRFLSADPYDVVDAIELAHQFARNAQRPALADRLAAGVLMLDEAVTGQDSAMALAEWLAAPPPVSTTDVVEPVLAAVLAASPGLPVLAKLAEANTEQAGRIRITLLRAEVDEIVRGTPADARAPLPPRQWSPDEAEEACIVVEVAAGAVAPERMDLLLRTATRFAVQPRLGRFAEAAGRFVDWWAEHPHAGVDPARWTCGPEMIDLLRDVLARRLAGPHAAEVTEAINARWWRLLAPTISDPFMPLDAAVAAAAVAAGEPVRQETIARFRDHLRAPDQPGTGEAVWEALFRTSAPTMAELKDFCTTLPSTAVSESLAQRAFAVLEKSKVSGRYLDVLRLLGHHIGDRENLHKLWEDDSRLRSWLSGFTRKGAETTAATLKDVSEAVFTARADEIIEVLLSTTPQAALEATVQGGNQLQQMLVHELPAVWNDEQALAARRDQAVVLAFLTGWQDSASEQVRAAFDKALERWAGKHTQSDYRRISKLLRGVDAEYAAAWHEWLKAYSQQQPKPTRAREVARRLFGRREK
ncbi:GTPase-associated protein 1-related protein [Saccharopolyspora sp. K220]|uniref:GTPase-associated protein 1-related protein n=1 Tax=Saccharopolyspora soli TaxID=2926618 RepID=UPI001F57146F|nr:GTPase-associated protein 1-related protein [Saccharopolyspora soli]MCI2416171.1 GTPase-associated protein 1-related protein [Saccharopolyspora soli]